MASSSTLQVTLAHAISFLIRPLTHSYPASTLIKLQSVLEANLTALYAPTWYPKDPLRGSGRRCLTLSPNSLPPRAIYSACLASGVQWFDWMTLMGGLEFDFFVDPGCVSVRVAQKGSSSPKLTTVWADEVASPTPRYAQFDEAAVRAAMKQQAAKTMAQQLMEYDDDDLFTMIAEEVNAPTYYTPTVDTFPVSIRSSSPLSAVSSDSDHSRCSSRSGFSANSSASSSLSGSPTAERKMSRRERARQARVIIDTTKTEITPYDGGKTTVLGGGIQLGSSKKQHSRQSSTNSMSWRRI